MFRGQYEHAIDDKGRLSIPAKFREVLKKEKSLVLSSADGYITAYRIKEWRNLENRIRSNPTFKRDRRDYLRLVYSKAEDVRSTPGTDPDLAGPAPEAGITREVVILGVMDEFEIWDKARWAQRKARPHRPKSCRPSWVSWACRGRVQRNAATPGPRRT
jgi:MraZ protein